MDRAQVSDPINHLFIPAIVLVFLLIINLYTVEWFGWIGHLITVGSAVVLVVIWAYIAPVYPKERYENDG